MRQSFETGDFAVPRVSDSFKDTSDGSQRVETPNIRSGQDEVKRYKEKEVESAVASIGLLMTGAISDLLSRSQTWLRRCPRSAPGDCQERRWQNSDERMP